MEIYNIKDYKTHEDKRYPEYQGETIIINFELSIKKSNNQINERIPKFDSELANKLAQLIE